MAEPDQLSPFHCCQNGFLVAHQGGGSACRWFDSSSWLTSSRMFEFYFLYQRAESMSFLLGLKGLVFLSYIPFSYVKIFMHIVCIWFSLFGWLVDGWMGECVGGWADGWINFPPSQLPSPPLPLSLSLAVLIKEAVESLAGTCAKFWTPHFFRSHALSFFLSSPLLLNVVFNNYSSSLLRPQGILSVLLFPLLRHWWATSLLFHIYFSLIIPVSCVLIIRY